MKTLLLLFIAIGVAGFCHAADLIEKSWYTSVDGAACKGEYIDLNTNNTERLYIRYSPLTDDGVELERTTNNIVVWRAHVQPIIPLESHSKYCHEVSVLVNFDQIAVTSAAGLSLTKSGFSISANSKDAREVYEIHSLKTGALISRKVYNLRVDH